VSALSCPLQERLWKLAAASQLSLAAACFDRRKLRPTKPRVCELLLHTPAEFGGPRPDKDAKEDGKDGKDGRVTKASKASAAAAAAAAAAAEQAAAAAADAAAHEGGWRRGMGLGVRRAKLQGGV